MQEYTFHNGDKTTTVKAADLDSAKSKVEKKVESKRGWRFKWTRRGEKHTLHVYNSRGAKQDIGNVLMLEEGAAQAAPKNGTPKKKSAAKKSAPATKKATPKKPSAPKPTAAQREWLDYLPDMVEAAEAGDMDFVLQELSQALQKRASVIMNSSGPKGDKPQRKVSPEAAALIDKARKAGVKQNVSVWNFGKALRSVRNKDHGIVLQKGEALLVDPAEYENGNKTYVTIFTGRRTKVFSVPKSFVQV